MPDSTSNKTAPALTAKEDARLEQLMRASYALTKPERKRLTQLLQKHRRHVQATGGEYVKARTWSGSCSCEEAR